MEFKTLTREVKATGEGMKLAGYASTFGGVDSYGDMIEKGAYTATLATRDEPVRMYFNHRYHSSTGPAPVGAWTAIKEDDVGLWVEGELTPGHAVAESVFASIKHGTINGLSIGYTVAPNGAEKRGDIRVLKAIDLFEVSPVEFPADSRARIDLGAVKSLTEGIETVRDLEHWLRDVAGLSVEASKHTLSIFKRVIREGSRDEEKKAALTELLNLMKLST
jgi:HK97 family phage prohead protease